MTVIAISGSGRSGSTLISLLLSQAPDVFNLGQLRHLPLAWAADAECSCGVSVRRCPVYGEAVTRGFGQAEGFARFGKEMDQFFEAAERLPAWGGPEEMAALRRSHAEFLRALDTLLSAISDVTGARHFVDSSKIPEMALALDLARPGELKVLNLLRNPRAVAVSWHLKKPKFSTTLRNARIWRKRQERLEGWGNHLGTRYRPLRYEDFAAAAEGEIGAVLAWAGLETPAGLFPAPNRAAISWRDQHLFPPANETVLAQRLSDVPIRPSNGWRDRKYRLIHLIAMAMSGPLAKRNYPDNTTT